jgi:uncharacterized protein with HEPN domain
MMDEREPRFYVDDMLSFCETALRYSAGFDQAALQADPMRYDAILRNLELIGEAATHVPDAWRLLAPAVPWRAVIGTRNRLAHAYLGIDTDAVWDILVTDLPRLRRALAELLSKL